MIGVKLGLHLGSNVPTLLHQALSAIRRNGGTLIGIPDNFAGAYIDSAGTTPVTAVGDVIGRVNDRIGSNHASQPTTASKPVVTRVPKRLGPNLVVNGTFDANLAGWTNPDTAPSVTEWVAGQARMTAAAGGSLARLRQQVPVVAGKTYQASVSVTGITGTPSAALALGNSSSDDATYGNIPLSTAGRFAREVTPTGSIIGFAFTAGNATGGSITLDNIEVREVLDWTNAISFDGSNDFLQTGITTGNEGWICAGVQFGGAAGANETVFASGAGSATQKGVWLLRNSTASGLRMGVGNGTELAVIYMATLPLLNVPRVVEGGWDASTVFAGVDGTINSTAKTGDVTAPGTALIGAFLSGILPLNGLMTAIIYTPVLPSAADRALIRKWVGSLQGQTL